MINNQVLLNDMAQSQTQYAHAFYYKESYYSQFVHHNQIPNYNYQNFLYFRLYVFYVLTTVHCTITWFLTLISIIFLVFGFQIQIKCYSILEIHLSLNIGTDMEVLRIRN